MPAARSKQIGDLVRRGIALFSEILPILPASNLIGAISAAAISKIIDIRERRVSEILSSEVSLSHISYVEPSETQLSNFYARNLLHPELASEFENEIASRNIGALREYYPFLYGTLVLKREIPSLLFHTEIEQKQFRRLAENYRTLSQGYASIEGDAEVEKEMNLFAAQFLEVVDEVYGATREEWRNKDNRFYFDLIDYVREVASI